jgi:hypothetical protein
MTSTLTPRFVSTKDAELTCFLCRSDRKCDYETTTKIGGSKVTIGIHAECLAIGQAHAITPATGIDRIVAERQRQLSEEGYTASHDEMHRYDELAWAAVCYAAPKRVYVQIEHIGHSQKRFVFSDPWPWNFEDDKRVPEPNLDDRIRQLEKAGALIAAEIDRLLCVRGDK